MLKLLDSRSNSVESLLGRWTADAATLRSYGQEAAAALVSKMAGELRGALDIAPATSIAQAGAQEAPGALLDVDEAAKRIGMSTSWLYRNGKRMPFARKIGARLLFDPVGLSQWLRTKGVGRAA